ncbi:MAG: Gfo/Idh/MocA family oxidoreductase, partial [Planctomycetota bacterium]|nr:Gfo/Idh/MocA family oxidoreductase [Planctomycetota bacterium]
SRRSLLKRTAAMAGAAVGAGLFRAPLIWSGEPANSKVGCAVIGCGGRGMTSHLPEAAKERLVAIVDVDEKAWAKSMKFLADKFKSLKVGDVKTFHDYRKMFDECQKDIDAVFVATPNHHHALPAMIAMKLGKAAYVEKPLAHTIQEARAMVEAARQAKVPTQMGNQGHSAEGYRRLCEYLWAGAIGNVTEVHCWSDRANGGVGPRPPREAVPAGLHWDELIGPSPFRDLHKDLHPHEWHGWYDFGNGSLGNMACHVMDGAVWALKLQWPTAIEAEQVLGGTDERYPVGDSIRYDFPARGDLPPVKLYWWDGKRPGVKGPAKGDERDNVAKGAQNRPPIVEELEKKYDRKLGGNGTLYIGDKGIMHSGTYGEGARILPEEKHKAFPPPAKSLPRTKGSFDDFLAACRSGKPATASSFEVGAVLTEIVLLGNLAQKAGVGKKVEWDGPNMKCPNVPEANALVQRENRKGWTI